MGKGLFGVDWSGKVFGSEDASTKRMPEFEESVGARKTLWDTLKGYGPETGYGAIYSEADWGDILDRAVKKTQQVYRGSPTSTGVYDKVKADVASRGMSDSPALGRMMLAAGAQESQDISNLAKDILFAQQQEKTRAEEVAKQSYLSNLLQLSGMRPETIYTPEQPGWLQGLLGGVVGKWLGTTSGRGTQSGKVAN